MNKLIRILSILILISISVYTSLFSYSSSVVTGLIIFFTSLFCFFTGRDSISYGGYTFKYIFLYIFWNMNYLVFIKHMGSLSSFVSTVLFKEVFIDILAVLAISNIILLIVKEKKILNIVFSILFITLFIFTKNYIFIYTSIFLIGNTLKIKMPFGIKNPIMAALDYVSVNILVLHRILLFLLLESKIITPSISNFIGAIVLIYVVGFAVSMYIRAFPIIRNII